MWPPNRKMLLRNNIGDSLTSQLSNFVSSTKQGYVTAWDADIEKNFGIVDTLLYSPGFSDHFIESGLYDTLIEKHTENELVAVLAHEVGHFKKKLGMKQN